KHPKIIVHQNGFAEVVERDFAEENKGEPIGFGATTKASGYEEAATEMFNAYEGRALTFNILSLEELAESIPYLAIALNEEAGEVAGVVKKMIRDEHWHGPITTVQQKRIALELGD